MSTYAVGIDISKAKFDAALLQGTVTFDATFSNNRDGFRRLAKWLKKRRAKQSHICIEATGRYGEAVAEYMHERGYVVSVVNPARIKAYGESRLQRNKNDRQDARLIAHFCATQQPDPWTPPSPTEKALRDMSRHLVSLKEDRTREANRRVSGLSTTVVLQTIDEHIAFLDAQIAQLEEDIADFIDQEPTLRRQKELLTSIPGIGDNTAAAFIAEIPDVTRFDSARQLAAHAGLTPRHHHSGSSVHRPGRLAKTGNSQLRRLLFFPAITAIRWNPIIIAFARRLAAKGKKKMIIVVAAMHKLLQIVYGVLKHGRAFDPDYLVNVQVTA